MLTLHQCAQAISSGLGIVTEIQGMNITLAIHNVRGTGKTAMRLVLLYQPGRSPHTRFYRLSILLSGSSLVRD